MSCLVFSCPLFHWMLDFSLASGFRFVSIQNWFAQTAFFTGFWLVLVCFFVVQYLQIRLQECGFDLAMRLKFQVNRCIS
jgi:hypothetical protein